MVIETGSDVLGKTYIVVIQRLGDVLANIQKIGHKSGLYGGLWGNFKGARSEDGGVGFEYFFAGVFPFDTVG